MARTKLFISYSHRDHAWLEQLKIHLSLLMRRSLVHVWSDTRIGIGRRWQEEIESALGESDAAVLLITPDFLASDFIWNEELPRLVAHQKQGMQILPLIARPCAWRIAPELAELQSRPADGRALALNDNAQIDLALAEFVYELADRLTQLPASVASEERTLHRTAATEIRSAAQSGPGTLRSRRVNIGSAAPFKQGQTWAGIYHPTERRLRLVIVELAGRQLIGRIEYDDHSVTDVKGEWYGLDQGSVPEALRMFQKSMHEIAGTVTLRELRLLNRGSRPPQLDGEYLALVGESIMKGVWHSGGGGIQGHFELQLGA